MVTAMAAQILFSTKTFSPQRNWPDASSSAKAQLLLEDEQDY